MDMAKEYDLVIIGAGPGGYTAALKAAEYGIRTLVIEGKKAGRKLCKQGMYSNKGAASCIQPVPRDAAMRRIWSFR